MSSEYELSITRLINAPPAMVFRIWTERTEEWFAPKPWRTRIIEQDLRAGGRSALIMSGPDGDLPQMEGVFLEVVPNERIVSTDAFTAGWLPQKPFMTAIYTFAEEGGKTRYTATARHWDEAAMNQHREMGFEEGWSICAAQLAEIAEA